MSQDTTRSIKDRVMDKIKEGKVHMHSKSYFIAKTALLVTGIVFVTLFAMFVSSLILFLMRLEGLSFLPQYGLKGTAIYFRSLPWVLVLVAVIFLILLEIFAEHFSFAYRKPLIFSVVGVIFLVFVGSYALYATDLHLFLLQSAESDRLPIAGPIYKMWGAQHDPNFILGRVAAIENGGLEVENRNGQLIQVKIADEKNLARENIEVNDVITVVGDRKNNTINSSEIRKVQNPQEINFFRHHQMHLENLEMKEEMPINVQEGR